MAWEMKCRGDRTELNATEFAWRDQKAGNWDRVSPGCSPLAFQVVSGEDQKIEHRGDREDFMVAGLARGSNWQELGD